MKTLHKIAPYALMLGAIAVGAVGYVTENWIFAVLAFGLGICGFDYGNR